MKKCDCKIMNTLSRYPKVWPWLGVAGYALDGAELMVNVPAAVTGAVIGTGVVGLNYTHAEAKKIGVKRARVLHRVFCAMTGLGIAAHVIGVKRPRR